MSQTNNRKSNVSYGIFGQASNKQMKKSILHKTKYEVVPVIYHGVDVTPKPLNLITTETGTKERFLSESLAKITSTSKFQSGLLNQQGGGNDGFRRTQITQVYDDVFLESISLSDIQIVESETDEKEVKMEKLPDRVSLILNETDTFNLLDIPSSTVLKETDEGNDAEKDNEYYEYITEGKGRNRKVFNIETQTIPILYKSRSSQCDDIRKADESTFINNWTMYDTYFCGNTEHIEKNNFEELHILNEVESTSTITSNSVAPLDRHCIKLFTNDRFLDAVEVIERLLSNNYYCEEQKRFKDMIEVNPYTETKDYNYKMNMLFSFCNETTKGRCVTCLDWNLFNPDLLAVGYGTFGYPLPKTDGYVMIWSIKNPTQPERSYNFPHPVTSIVFSKINPNLLAIGLYDGSIKIINITDRSISIIRESSVNNSPSFGPVTQVIWSVPQNDYETLMVTFGDGRVCLYTMTHTELKCLQIMRTAKTEGKLKGIDTMRKYKTNEFAVSRYTAATSITLHPQDKAIYFVGTEEGVIHRCSTNYLNRHLYSFMAHEGAVTMIKFISHANKCFLTIGDDGYIRVWIESINDPIIETYINLHYINDFDYSPSHSTIFCTIRGANIYIWDIQRKLYYPQSITKNDEGHTYTTCRFSNTGSCIFAGDINGEVQVFALDDLPYPPFFQENLFFQSAKNILVTRPDLIEKLKKLNGLCFDKEPIYF